MLGDQLLKKTFLTRFETIGMLNQESHRASIERIETNDLTLKKAFEYGRNRRLSPILQVLPT